jgi:uncharacterized protein YjbJ (UPF0337 family)
MWSSFDYDTHNLIKGRNFMSIPNKDEVKGKWEQVKGTVKDKVGEVTGNRHMEAEGEVQNAEGKSQETWGKLKRGVSDTVDSVGEAISNAGKNLNK